MEEAAKLHDDITEASGGPAKGGVGDTGRAS
jgi:hypothetical protein